jgi:hypothetical protein
LQRGVIELRREGQRNEDLRKEAWLWMPMQRGVGREGVMNGK